MSITRNRKPVKFTCSIVTLTIEVNDHRYSVDEIPAGEFGSKAFRLTKHSARDGGTYDVIRDVHGCVCCDCPDYEARHRGNGYGLCKHGRALVELGLMPGPIAPAGHIADVSNMSPAPCCDPAEALPCLACVESPKSKIVLDLAKPFTETDLDKSPPGGDLDASLPDPVTLPGELVDPWDAEAPPELWPSDTDESIWDLGPDPDAATLDLAGLVDRQAAAYRAWPLEAGEMIARALDELALKIRLTGATTPAEYEARIEIEDAAIRAQWEAIGYDLAMAECGERAACLPAFGHPA